MKQEYIDYWKKHKVPCVGVSRIGNGRWESIHADGQTRRGAWWTRCIPQKYITWNRKGLCLDLSTFTRQPHHRNK